MEDLSKIQKRLVFLVLSAVVLGSLSLLYRSLYRGPAEVITLAPIDQAWPESFDQSWRVTVHLCGAVNNPGVYLFQPGDRLYQALESAGGCLPEADLEALNLAAPLEDGKRIYIPRRKPVPSAPQQPKGSTVPLLPKEPLQTKETPAEAESLVKENLPPLGGHTQSLPTLGQAGIQEEEIITAQSESGFQDLEETDGSALSISRPLDVNTATSDELQSVPGIGPVLAERILNYRRQNGYFQTLDDLLQIKGIGLKTLEKFKAYLCVAN